MHPHSLEEREKKSNQQWGSSKVSIAFQALIFRLAAQAGNQRRSNFEGRIHYRYYEGIKGRRKCGMEVGMVKSHKKYILTNRERRVLFLPWTSPVKDTFCFLNMALQVTFVFWRRAVSSRSEPTSPKYRAGEGKSEACVCEFGEEGRDGQTDRWTDGISSPLRCFTSVVGCVLESSCLPHPAPPTMQQRLSITKPWGVPGQKPGWFFGDVLPKRDREQDLGAITVPVPQRRCC